VAPRFEHGPPIIDRRAFQRNYGSPWQYRANIYRRPPGWVYRHWVYGEFLPSLFFAQTYWITNWWVYGLDRPPQGCEWIRYGNDALLVDVLTGEILQVVYDLYY
jgi:Ni/Co efflux regulator RcnB